MARARAQSRLADVRVRGADALQAAGARRRAREDRQGLLPGVSARPERAGRPRLADGTPMKLVTFGGGKVGQVSDGTIAELDVPTMREYFERGGAPNGKEHALEQVRLQAPIVPKKFFHTAGNFREHEEESKRVDWSHEIAPWIVFFQNVDAIIGPEEPIVYPEHLTEELDYELELAVVLRKSGKWFSPEEAADYVGGDVIEAEIERIGVLRNPVVSWQEAHGEPLPRVR